MGVSTHEPPTSSIAQAWQDVDTSIDAETPEQLSQEQFDRYVATVTELLTAAGLTVTKQEASCDEAELELTNRALPYSNTLQLFLRSDRSAEWHLEIGDELLENTPAQALATLITGLLAETRQ